MKEGTDLRKVVEKFSEGKRNSKNMLGKQRSVCLIGRNRVNKKSTQKTF